MPEHVLNALLNKLGMTFLSPKTITSHYFVHRSVGLLGSARFRVGLRVSLKSLAYSWARNASAALPRENGLMGWEALDQWGHDVVRIEVLSGGVANEVWSVRLNGGVAVARLGARSDADLAWEVELLQHLDREGLTVPVPIPTMDGRRFADGLVVMPYIEGQPPETEADWRRVADALRQLHRSTQNWPQRPGWRSSTDLLVVARTH